MPKYVKEACDSMSVVGEGFQETFTSYGLRATCRTFLFQAGHQMEVIARKSGHRDPRTVLSYQNTQGELGQELQSDMFVENVSDLEIGVGPSLINKGSLECEENVNIKLTKSVRFEKTLSGFGNSFRRPKDSKPDKVGRIDTLAGGGVQVFHCKD